MATIRKRGNKFQVQVRRASFQSATKSFERLTEDKAWARQYEILFDQGETGNQKPTKIWLADIHNLLFKRSHGCEKHCSLQFFHKLKECV